jgi:glycosyltransferase involved in cell wall biosynthesis
MGQPKAYHIAQFPDIELRVVVPTLWQDDDGVWRDVDRPASDAAFEYEVLKVRWPYVGPFKRYFHYYPNLAQTYREFQPDIIDIWEEPWGLVSAHATRLREKLLPRSILISETEQNINKTLPMVFERMRRYCLKRADFVVARSSEALEVTRQKGYDGPAAVVPNAVDAKLFHPMDRAACRTKLGVDGFVLGYIGRMVQIKGLEDLLEAIPHCTPEVNLLMVGDGDFKAALEAKVAALGIGQRVRFINGKPLNELPEIYNALDLFVLPSWSTPTWKEQFGRVIIESHACGIPVIGSDSGAIPEVIGFGGHTFPERQPRAMAQIIRDLASDPRKTAELGEIGRRQVEQRYTWKHVAERMYEIYCRLASQSTDDSGASRLRTRA